MRRVLQPRWLAAAGITTGLISILLVPWAYVGDRSFGSGNLFEAFRSVPDRSLADVIMGYGCFAAAGLAVFAAVQTWSQNEIRRESQNAVRIASVLALVWTLFAFFQLRPGTEDRVLGVTIGAGPFIAVLAAGLVMWGALTRIGDV